MFLNVRIWYENHYFRLSNGVIFLIFQVEPEAGKLQEQRYLQAPLYQEPRPPEDQGRQGQHPPENQGHQDLLPQEDQDPQEPHPLEDQGHQEPQEHHLQVPHNNNYLFYKRFNLRFAN